jgi:hypothetical protein
MQKIRIYLNIYFKIFLKNIIFLKTEKEHIPNEFDQILKLKDFETE